MPNSGHAQLTTLIVSPTDLRKLRRELESLDDALRQATLRKTVGKADSNAGAAPKAAPAPSDLVDTPTASRLAAELASETGVDLQKAADRTQLIAYLSELVEKAPVLHISFASEPSAAFMSKLIIWLRANIHPQVLVHLGLQPSIAAGCVIRTANKQYDFSLTQAFDKQRALLVDSIKAGGATAAQTSRETSQIEAETLQAALAGEIAKEAVA